MCQGRNSARALAMVQALAHVHPGSLPEQVVGQDGGGAHFGCTG